MNMMDASGLIGRRVKGHYSGAGEIVAAYFHDGALNAVISPDGEGGCWVGHIGGLVLEDPVEEAIDKE